MRGARQQNANREALPAKGGAVLVELGAPLVKLVAFAICLFVLSPLALEHGVAQPPQVATETTKRDLPSQAPTQAGNPPASTVDRPRAQNKPVDESSVPSSLEQKLKQIAASGRIQQIGESSSARLHPAFPLAPGAPPILAFRYFDGRARHRFGDLDLVMDDAGH